VCRYYGPLEDGRLYLYKMQEGAVGVGTLGLQPSLYMFSDAYSKRAFVPSEIYILGRVKASMRVVDHLLLIWSLYLVCHWTKQTG